MEKKSLVIYENRKAGVCICVVVLFSLSQEICERSKKGVRFLNGFGFEDAARKYNRKQYFLSINAAAFAAAAVIQLGKLLRWPLLLLQFTFYVAYLLVHNLAILSCSSLF